MTAEERKSWWQTFHKFQLSRERTWQPKINKALKNQYKAVADHLQANGIQSTISNVDFLVRFDELATIIKNIYIDAGTVFGGKAYQLVKKQATAKPNADTKRERKDWYTFHVLNANISTKGMMPIGYNEELINEIIRYFQISLLNEAVLPISEKTKDIVLKILIESQQQGVSINDIVKQLTATELTYQRARTIARTETVKAANYGAVQSVKKLGYDTLKIWISATDLRTRRIPRDEADHLRANGMKVPMNEPFKIRDKKAGGFVDMMQPGDPKGGAENVVNCRCCCGFEVL